MDKTNRNAFDAFNFDWREQIERRHKEEWDNNHWQCNAFLDVNDKHPALFGDAILLRDDDGMGFALGLARWRGEYVRITIERVPAPDKRLWSVK